MPYYAPFYQPYTNYTPTPQNGFMGQNFAPQQNVQTNAQLTQQADTSMIWVLGKNEAESYPVAPNCQVVLWDKNAPTLYVKSMSANGVPNLRTLDFTERSETPLKSPTAPLSNESSNYATHEDITALNGKIEGLTARCETLEQFYNEKVQETPKTTAKKVKGADE